MKTHKFSPWTGAALVAVALVFVLSAGNALAVSIPTCNSFDATGTPIYSTAVPPDATGTTNCTDFFGVGNWANSPLPSSPITGFTLINGGSGYINPLVVITDPNGSGASATATMLSGVIAGLTVGTQGTGYILPRVAIVDVGAGGTIGAPTCGGVAQPACGSGAMVTAVLGGPYTGGMLKFQDPLKDLKTVIATPDTTTFPGSDYYEIALVQYSQKMHANLPPTTLRGYVQLPSGSNSCAAAPVAPPSYLGPVILAQKDRPVRVKFTNCLPTGSGGNLFIPVDTTYMGAGTGPGGASYTENRATLHLHGGATPWISDGTPHQWTVPVGEGSTLQKGDSVAYVPDMFFDSTGKVTPLLPQCSTTITTNCYPNAVPAGLSNNPGQGALTFFWTNQQGGRLMFYHDHAYGLTRLNVYAGEAAGYLLVDPAEEDKLAAGTAPGTVGTTPDLAHLIPLVIQDKSFVPSAAQLAAQDPTWAGNFGATPLSGTGSNGDLWFPHVYMPNQNPNDPTMASGFGHWDYGAWFFPPMTSLTAATPNTAVTIPCTSAAFPGQVLAPTSACPTCGCPIIPNPSGTPESFMDTPVVNGVAYPVLHVAPAAYRFKILTAGNDRSLNLSWYVADATNTEVAMLPAAPPTTGSALPLCTAINPVAVPALDLGLATALLDATGNPLNGTGLPANCWPNFGPQPGIPAPQTMWAADGRAGGVPDPRTAGPPWIQIGTEGGILPAPVVIPATPANFEQNVRSITIGSVAIHGLWVGPAERADVIVDFSKFAGKTLILYNDAPAPAPASDSRLDYFTGDGDQSPIGGAPNTPAGYGPNTRTIMQVVVDQTAPNTVPFNLNALKSAFASTATTQGIFASTQPTTIVPQAAYNSAYNASFPNTYMGIQNDTLTFAPIAPLTFDQSCTATAPAQCAVLGQKAIQELFTLDYGRMNATLGVELPLTNFLTQTTIPYGYVDPPTEIIRQGDTQLWKITHNGVDSHFIHFHLFNVQVVNRVGWDGSNRPIDANEFGWKDTVRMNPLEDVLVALQPITPLLPFPIPDSIRNMDVTGDPTTFTNVDPNNNPVTVTNTPINFGWEYVWHCHILGHEENDMMRPIIFQVAPYAPSSLAAAVGTTGVQLTWTDNSASEDSYTVERDSTSAFATATLFPVNAGNSTGFSTPGYAQTVAFTDTTAVPGAQYFYRVQANDSFTPVVSVYPPAFQPQPMSSAWSNIASVGSGPIAVVAPTSLAYGNQLLNTTSAAQTVTLSNTGSAALLVSSITITGANAGDFAIAGGTCGPTPTIAAGGNCTISITFTPTALLGRSAVLVISNNDPAHNPLSVSLTGTGTAPNAVVSPTSLAFGNQPLNTISTAQTVTLSNTGSAALLVSSITITGANPGDFAIAGGTCGPTPTVAAGGNCTIRITFTPTALLGRSATLVITNSDLLHNPLSVSLTGTGITAALAIDGTASTNRNTVGAAITSPALTTTGANRLLLAFVATDAPTTGTNTTVTGITNTGGALTWVLVRRTNTQLGTAEIWRAFAPTARTVTVTARFSQNVFASLITVVAFSGTDTSGTNGSGAIGATGTGNGASGAPTASLTTTRANSWVFGVGNDWDSAVARTLGPNQTMMRQFLATVGDTYWVQRQTNTTPAAGTVVTINDTAPTADRWNLSIVEVRTP